MGIVTNALRAMGRAAFGNGAMEKRAIMSGFTAELITARESYISGRRGLAELTATVQTCVSLWEYGLALAAVSGTNLLTRRILAMIGRSLALRGEALFLIDGALIPCADWDLRTRQGRPAAYRVSISEAGGGSTMTALAGEVLHLKAGSDVVTPWAGQAPLRRARLTAGMLHAIETALAEAYENMPLGSQIVPMPEIPAEDATTLGRSFRGQRGRVLLRESVNVGAAGGPAPSADWKPADVTPDLQRAVTASSLAAARGGICASFGVLPALFADNTTGPLVREGQRHLAQWTLQPIAELIAEEASEKLGSNVELDCITPLQAFDQGGAARALATVIEALVRAKEGGLAPGDVGAALQLIDWTGPGAPLREDRHRWAPTKGPSD
jgi:hypothetical protein